MIEVNERRNVDPRSSLDQSWCVRPLVYLDWNAPAMTKLISELTFLLTPVHCILVYTDAKKLLKSMIKGGLKF